MNTPLVIGGIITMIWAWIKHDDLQGWVGCIFFVLGICWK